MNPTFEPNPPSRRDEDFPRTTTLPDGWVADALMGKYNPPASASTGTRPTPVVSDESLFTRGLEPFPRPNTIPSGWDLSAL